MPYQLLFMAGASSTTSTNTIAGLVVSVASLGALIGGFAVYTTTTANENNKEHERERARRERYERDRYIREHVNDTAQLASTETPRLIAAVQAISLKYSELITGLTHTINKGEQGNEALHNLKLLMQNHLDEFSGLTSNLASELPASQQQLANLTTELSATSGAFIHNQEDLSLAVDEISQASSQLRCAADLVHSRIPGEMILLTQQNNDYKIYIEKLIQRVEEQSQIIQALEKKLKGKEPISSNKNWTNERVLKKTSNSDSPGSRASPSYFARK